MHAQVKDGRVVKVGRVPRVGVDAEGRAVSGFDSLPADELRAAGWLPVVDERPEHDPKTHRLTAPTYVVDGSRVVARYTVEPIPAPSAEPDADAVLAAALEAFPANGTVKQLANLLAGRGSAKARVTGQRTD